ncbi:MAG TPA: hypothetical protein VH062_35915 [Polyangiaceae bacterium]|nr:hypothetical protein [Polyangiaceae bacterium]
MALPSRPPLDPATERAERAGRVAAMLDRWAAEDTTPEPEWDVETFERLDLTRSLGRDETTPAPKP